MVENGSNMDILKSIDQEYVQKAYSDCMGIEEKLNVSLSFADNGCDDLDVVEILIHIERIVGISIPSDIEILCLETEKSIEEIFRFKQFRRDKLIDNILN